MAELWYQKMSLDTPWRARGVERRNLAARQHEPAHVPLVRERAAQLRERPLAQNRRRVVRDHLSALSSALSARRMYIYTDK